MNGTVIYLVKVCSGQWDDYLRRASSTTQESIERIQAAMKKGKELLLMGTILLAVVVNSCTNKRQDYKHTYTARVTYVDNSVDTLMFSMDSFNGGGVYMELNPTPFPCLAIGCGGVHSNTIACGVKKYEILSESKTPIIKLSKL